MYRLRRMPKRTDYVKYAGYKFEVVDIDNYKIDQLLVTRLTTAPSPVVVQPGKILLKRLAQTTNKRYRTLMLDSEAVSFNAPPMWRVVNQKLLINLPQFCLQ